VHPVADGNGVLFETFRVWVDHGGSVRATGEMLFCRSSFVLPTTWHSNVCAENNQVTLLCQLTSRRRPAAERRLAVISVECGTRSDCLMKGASG
jgi:hypothetical protein